MLLNVKCEKKTIFVICRNVLESETELTTDESLNDMSQMNVTVSLEDNQKKTNYLERLGIINVHVQFPGGVFFAVFLSALIFIEY